MIDLARSDGVEALPVDREYANLVGRVWRPDVGGPSVVSVRDNEVVDITMTFPTIADLLQADDMASAGQVDGETIGDIEAVLRNSHHSERRDAQPWLLAPVDLQSVRGAGVTFATSLLERLIEEMAAGDRSAASDMRADITSLIGTDLRRLVPGSKSAMDLKEHLLDRGLWSQYLEVGIGPDAEIFTKCPPMAAVGTGAEIGILRESLWNNPEPELALVVNPAGTIVAATLANDVNLRDIEGRSALLLGRAKDNHASAAIGPFIRLLDSRFTMDDLRSLDVSLFVGGLDGFTLEEVSSMSYISRDLVDLVNQAHGPHHQYPDGLVLLSGTMFAPTVDRTHEGQGFTHQPGDAVRISSPQLGVLANTVQYCDEIEPWTFGTRSLLHHLVSLQCK